MTFTAYIWCYKFTVFIYYTNNHLKVEWTDLNEFLSTQILDLQDVNISEVIQTITMYLSVKCQFRCRIMMTYVVKPWGKSGQDLKKKKKKELKWATSD